jgi:acyl carrier protein
MNNNELYDAAFIESFSIKAEQLKGLAYQSVQLWDSVGHMSLIALLEDKFDLMMETDDIIDLSSYEKGKEILSEKYGIRF